METEKDEIIESQKPTISRIVYTIFFLVVGRIVSIIVCLASIFQIIYGLIFSKPNEKVLDFTSSLSEFAKQIVLYVSFNSEEKPWPFGEWAK